MDVVEVMPRWTDEEIRLLKEMWDTPEISLDDMALVLTTRNRDTIRKKAAELKMCPVSERKKPVVDLEYYKKLMEVVEG